MPNKKPIIKFAEQKKSKNDLQPESDITDLLNSKLAETNQSKINTESQKEENELIFTDSTPDVQLSKKLSSSKSAQKSKYPILGYYRLHRGLPKPQQQ